MCEAVSRLDIGANVLLEAFGIDQIGGADAATADLVFIRGADAARGRADLPFAAARFRQQVEIAVIRQNQVRFVADKQTVPDVDAVSGELIELAEQRLRVDDHAVADHADDIRMQDARRNETQHEFRAVDIHRMAGVVAALVAGHDIEPRCQQVDDFSFAFVAPLCAKHGEIHHRFTILLSKAAANGEARLASA
jgi:hypothetical protein